MNIRERLQQRLQQLQQLQLQQNQTNNQAQTNQANDNQTNDSSGQSQRRIQFRTVNLEGQAKAG